MTIADSLRHLGLSALDPRSDGELVGQFVRTRDEGAFAELLRRHGPTVYGVCRRVLANSPDADDAFQAVFLVLARKAVTIKPPGMVGNWLYGVAVRTANKARVMNARKANGRRQPAGGLESFPAASGSRSDPDTLAVIDAELAALPELYRAAFVACELNGRSRSEAARDLGWPEGTVAARLAKAREMLAARLSKRGVTLAVGAFAVAAVPAATASETLTAVRELLAVGTASAVTPTAQQLSDEVVKAMNLFSAKWVLAASVLAVGLAAGGAVLVAGPGQPPPVREPIKAPVPKAEVSEWKEADPITFKDGGRVTSIAFAPSGKTFAVCRADGKIDFFDPTTRKHQQSMNFLGDPKANPKREGATYPAIAFRPTPHAKLGDVFAITHKNGVNFGTTDIGLLVDDPPAVEGLPTNWLQKGFDPHQVLWHTDDCVEATNGVDRLLRNFRDANYHISGGGTDSRETHRPTVMASLASGSRSLWLVLGERGGGVELRAFPTGPGNEKPLLTGHNARAITAAVSKDSKRIVSADEMGTLIVWDGETFKEKSRVEVGEGVAQLDLAPDGKTVAVVRAFVDTTLLGTSGRTLFNLELFVFDVTDPPAKPKPLWSARNLLSDAKTFTGPVSLAFSPDGKTLLAAFADPYIPDDPKERGAEPKSLGVKVWELVPKK